MALLVTGNFYLGTFLATTNAAWAALGAAQPYGISGVAASAIYVAAPTAFAFYVVDATLGQIAYKGGQAFGLDDTLLNGAPIAGTNFTLDADDASQTFWTNFVNGGTGTLYQYDANSGLLREYSAVELGLYQAFIAAI